MDGGWWLFGSNKRRCGFLMLAALVASHREDRGMFSRRVNGGHCCYCVTLRDDTRCLVARR